MSSVGIRELKQYASEVIRRAAAGESIEVTLRGRRVARIVPIRETGLLDELIEEGRAVRAQGDLLEVRPLQKIPGMRPPSEILAEMRAQDER